LIFVHPEIVPQLVDNGAPDLITDFTLAGADRLDVLLVIGMGLGRRGEPLPLNSQPFSNPKMSLKERGRRRWDFLSELDSKESVAVAEAVGMWKSRSDFQALWEDPKGHSTERHFHSPVAAENLLL